jgi:hypothetical protein
MVEDWYASVGEDVMFAAMLDKAELTKEGTSFLSLLHGLI